MISIITKIPIKQAIKIVRDITDNETTKLVKVCLNSTYFSFRGNIYEQIEGITMGSPLSPIVANIYMDFFEKEALQSFPLQLKWWIRFIDNTNIDWSHGRENLNKLLDHLNSRSDHIKLTMEVEEENIISFIDVLIRKNVDGSLGHQVYRKKKHTER